MIVDDHPVVVAGFSALINARPDLKVCCNSDRHDEALALARQRRPDAVIVDISLAEGNGLDLVKHLVALEPPPRIIVCSMHDEPFYVQRSLQAGAMGFLSKQEATADVITAVREVLAGRRYLSAELRARMEAEPGGRWAGIDDLSSRELQVFTMISDGDGLKRIADQLHLSSKTVESHRENIKRKLGVASTAELNQYAFQWRFEHSRGGR